MTQQEPPRDLDAALKGATILVDLCCPERERIGHVLVQPEPFSEGVYRIGERSAPGTPMIALRARWAIDEPGMGDAFYFHTRYIDDPTLPADILCRCDNCPRGERDIAFSVADIRRKTAKAGAGRKKRPMSVARVSDALQS